MSKPSTSAPVDDTHRRKWDKEEYIQRAREREEDEDDEEGGHRRRPAPPALPRAPLKQRDFEVDLSSNLGRTQVVLPTASLNQQAGYFCDVCQCVVKDSANYLDHINGKKHQKALGMSMRVERSSLEQVQGRFAALKKRKEEQREFTEQDFELRLLKQQEEEMERKKARKEKKKEKK
ncbi:unnamed protein product, partial [Closterium sp. Naga37s-1]